MADSATFAPAFGQGQTVAPGVASASVVCGLNSRNLCLTNLGTFVCYVRASLGASTATIADYPVSPGSQVSITKSQGSDIVSFISPGGTTSLHIIPGDGF